MRRDTVSSKSPSPFLPPLCLTPSVPSGTTESLGAMTTGHPSPVASLQPAYTLFSHCDSLDSDSTACTHNVFIGRGCMWHFTPPSRDPRAPELRLCDADGRRGPRLDGEVIFVENAEASCSVFALFRALQCDHLPVHQTPSDFPLIPDPAAPTCPPITSFPSPEHQHSASSAG